MRSCWAWPPAPEEPEEPPLEEPLLAALGAAGTFGPPGRPPSAETMLPSAFFSPLAPGSFGIVAGTRT